MQKIKPVDIIIRAAGDFDSLTEEQKNNLQDYGRLERPSVLFKQLHSGSPNLNWIREKYLALKAVEDANDLRRIREVTPIPSMDTIDRVKRSKVAKGFANAVRLIAPSLSQKVVQRIDQENYALEIHGLTKN